MRLCERDVNAFGCPQHLSRVVLQQAAVGGVGYRLVLHCAVDDDSAEFFQHYQLEINCHVDGLSPQLLQTLIT